MDTILIVLSVLFAVLVGIVLLAGCAWLYFDIRKRQRLMSDVMNNLSKQCALVSDRLAELPQIPGYLEGLVKVCGDQVMQITDLKDVVERFRISMFGPPKSRDAQDKASFQEYSDEDADVSFEIQQMVENGSSFQEARDRVRGARSGKFTLG